MRDYTPITITVHLSERDLATLDYEVRCYNEQRGTTIDRAGMVRLVALVTLHRWRAERRERWLDRQERLAELARRHGLTVSADLPVVPE